MPTERLNKLSIPDDLAAAHSALDKFLFEEKTVNEENDSRKSVVSKAIDGWDSESGRCPVRATSVTLWSSTVDDALTRRKRNLERKIRRLELESGVEQKAAEDAQRMSQIKQGLESAEKFANSILSSSISSNSSANENPDLRRVALEEKHRLLSRNSGSAEGMDVEELMQRRRLAQVEAEKIMKKERERRIEEEKNFAIQNEAINLGLPRLIAIRGHVRPRAVVVACKTASLNLNSHFVLESEDFIFHFKPPKADIMKLKFAVKTIAALRKERQKKVKVISMKKYNGILNINYFKAFIYAIRESNLLF